VACLFGINRNNRASYCSLFCKFAREWRVGPKFACFLQISGLIALFRKIYRGNCLERQFPSIYLPLFSEYFS